MTHVRVLVVGLDGALSSTLRDADCDVDSVDTAAAATEALGREALECVVAAVDLPDGSGFDLAERAAERDDRLPAVVVGPEPLATVADRALEAGVAAYCPQAVPDAVPAEFVEEVTTAARRCRERRDRARSRCDGPGCRCVIRDGDVVDCGPEFASLVGASADVCGAPLSTVVAESDRADVEAAVRAAMDDAATVRFSPAGDLQRTLEATVQRSRIDDGALVATVEDVTERARCEQRLETDSEMLETLLTNVPMSIYFKDRQGRHQRVSRYLTKMDPDEFIRNDEGKVHPHPEDVLGKTDFDLYRPEFAEETVADDRQVMEAGEPVVKRLEEGTTNLGEALYTSTTKAPRYDGDGNVVGLVGVTVDVTDRIQHRQELERQNERLDEFSEVLTHDLRNPLQIAQGYVDTLHQRYDEDDDVVACSEALARIETLVDEIRSFVLEGRLVEDPEPVRLEEAVSDAWSTVETGDATVSVDGGLYFRADPVRLRRLLENLFRNAVEHGATSHDPQVRHGTPTDGGTTDPESTPGDVAVRVVAHDDGFSVEDDGPGIPTDAEMDVFERGFTTDEEGTGFGLAIVRNIVEAHGWTIEAGESDAGGARFTVSGVVRADDVLGQTIGDGS